MVYLRIYKDPSSQPVTYIFPTEHSLIDTYSLILYLLWCYQFGLGLYRKIYSSLSLSLVLTFPNRINDQIHHWKIFCSGGVQVYAWTYLHPWCELSCDSFNMTWTSRSEVSKIFPLKRHSALGWTVDPIRSSSRELPTTARSPASIIIHSHPHYQDTEN